MLTDNAGNAVEKRHFDAWGNLDKYWNKNGATTVPAEGILLGRGYTGHEHLLGVGLVHMNGRLYDPMLHRFLMPDNYVQDPFNTQNFNRYGYVLNNPLKYTDESGELWWLVPVAVALFTTDIGYEIQKYISPIAFKIDIKLGTHQLGLGFDASFGLPKLSPYAYRADIGATYFWKTYGDYKGWEIRTGYEHSILGLYHWGKTNYKAGEFTQTTGFKSLGIPHVLGGTASNDLWGDEGDRFRTSHQRIDFFGLSIGNSIFPGSPVKIEFPMDLSLIHI